jgi:hypothetical protein
MHSVDAGGDASTANSPCALDQPFGASVVLSELNTASEDASLRLLPDELTAIFMSSRPQSAGLPTHFNVWTTTRPSLAAPFGPPTLMPGANQTGSYTYWVAPTSDGLTLYINSDPGGRSQIFSTTRAGVDDAFPAPSLVDLAIGEGQGSPWIRTSGGRLYFDAFITSGADLYVADGVGSGIPTSRPLAGINEATSTEQAPVSSADELTMYFASDRPGAMGGLDIWVARRPTLNEPFEPPTAVAELNSTFDESPTWLSTDGCRLYIASDRGGARLDLYVAEKPRE